MQLLLSKATSRVRENKCVPGLEKRPATRQLLWLKQEGLRVLTCPTSGISDAKQRTLWHIGQSLCCMRLETVYLEASGSSLLATSQVSFCQYQRRDVWLSRRCETRDVLCWTKNDAVRLRQASVHVQARWSHVKRTLGPRCRRMICAIGSRDVSLQGWIQ